MELYSFNILYSNNISYKANFKLIIHVYIVNPNYSTPHKYSKMEKR